MAERGLFGGTSRVAFRSWVLSTVLSAPPSSSMSSSAARAFISRKALSGVLASASAGLLGVSAEVLAALVGAQGRLPAEDGLRGAEGWSWNTWAARASIASKTSSRVSTDTGSPLGLGADRGVGSSDAVDGAPAINSCVLIATSTSNAARALFPCSIACCGSTVSSVSSSSLSFANPAAFLRLRSRAARAAAGDLRILWSHLRF